MKIYIIHGWTYSLDKWQPLVGLLRARGIDAMQLKVPGLTEPSDKIWDIEKYINWLDDQLKGEKDPIIMGHSNGGRIALAYCNRYPNRFKQLILIDSAGVPHDVPAVALKLRLYKTLATLGKPLIFIPDVKKLFYRAIGGHDYFNAPPNMKQTMQHMLEADKTIDVSKVTTPTTIIWGRDDTITPLADAQRLHKGIQDSQLNVIDGGRHAPFYTHPEEVATLIIKALS